MVAEPIPTTEEAKEEFCLNAADLVEGLSYCLRAVCPRAKEERDRRPVLEGVYFDKQTGAMVATDMYRMHVFEAGMTLPASFILTAPACKELLKEAKKHNWSQFYFHFEGAELVSGQFRGELVEGEFPNYRRVIPELKDSTRRNRELKAGEDLVQALDWAAKVPGTRNFVNFDIGNKKVCFYSDPSIWASCQYEETGHDDSTPASFYGNPKFIADAIRPLDSRDPGYAEVSFPASELSPVVITRGNLFAVIMPAQHDSR